MSAQMESRADVFKRHKEEWAMFKLQFLSGPELSEEKAKAAKTLAEVLKIYQEGERRLYDFFQEDSDSTLNIKWSE